MVPQPGVQNAFSVIVGFDILLGLVLCFFGYLLSRIRIVFGLILGCAWGANIGFAISQNPWMAIVAGIVGGLMGAALSAAFYLMGLFLIGAFLGGFLGESLAALFHQNPGPAVIFIPAIAGGGIVLLFKKLRTFVTILATALGGAGFVVFGILSFLFIKTIVILSMLDLFARQGNLFGYAVPFCWLVLAATGIAIQYKLLPPDPEKLRIEKQMDSAGTAWDGDSSRL